MSGPRLIPCVVACVLFLVSGEFAAAQSVQPTDYEVWEVIYLGDQRIGYGHTDSRTFQEGRRTLVSTENHTYMKLSRFGQVLRFKTTLKTTETLDGNLIRFEYETANPPAAPSLTAGEVVGNELQLEITVAGRKQKRTVSVPSRVKSPAWRERSLRQQPLRPGERRRFESFEMGFNKVDTVRLSADEPRAVKLLDGKRVKLLKVTLTQDVTPTLSTRLYLDESGAARTTEFEILGLNMKTYQVSKEVALQKIAGAELDLAVKTLVRVDRIRNAHQTRLARYRVRTEGVDPAKYLVSDDSQSIKRVGPHEVELTVRAVRPRSATRFVAAKPEFTARSRFLQTDDRNVIEHARRAASNNLDQWRVATQMESYVSKRLAKKNFSTALASAAEVAKSLEGDCTEHAVLLAAMLRVKRIPSRLVVGLVYTDLHSAFGGHMWTEAYIGGEWVALDPTLGQGGTGAAHIKLAQSSFADDDAEPATAFVPLLNVLGRIEIEVLETKQNR